MDAGRAWHPGSWRGCTAAQLPLYADAAALAEVERTLSQAAAVAAIDQSEALKSLLAEAAAGRALLLQGGDCAETLEPPSPARVHALAELFGAIARQLGRGFDLPLVQVARIAGQFAKPRSMATERQGDRSLPAWRGDSINAQRFEGTARVPDPRRMLLAHAHALATRALLPDCLFTSHEALLLPYEEPLIRRDPTTGRHWSVSGHMLWVGDRTRQVDGAHVEFLSGIANPVGMKCGPELSAEDLLTLCDRLDPAREPGRLTLIVRLGAERIGDLLPGWLRAVGRAGRAPLWISDPMHGNTEREAGRKIRRLERIAAEAEAFFAIARSEGAWPGGLHIEMVPEPVTECLGGRGPATIAEMDANFRSACDPRLNPDQALQLAEVVARIGRKAAA
ncbi:3-deoxy-7-phosphoheptulonate synthase [Sphingomonas sp. GCM10030256]|uniref:3-deoxy-7-phosphoheptulonate synthase n=1 Tax=Sphingomonas sp. GCM10030256 TaxID=3273427 RepID=UPI00360B2089